MVSSTPRAPWFGRIAEFLSTSEEEVVSRLRHSYPGAETQVGAWRSTIRILRQAAAELVAKRPTASGWFVVLEYALPREGGRRVDVCFLTAHRLFVIEVKDSEGAGLAAREQCRAYVRDFLEYHQASHSLQVEGVVLATHSKSREDAEDSIVILGPGQLVQRLDNSDSGPTGAAADAWLAAGYHPLPSLVEAATLIFSGEPLPEIRRALSAGVPAAVDEMARIVEAAAARHEYHLVFLTGTPGSGKTLVGLEVVNRVASGGGTAVFLSGNAPLVQAIRSRLGRASKSLVQDVMKFIEEYTIRDSAAAPEFTFVFDEAQRAWDAESVALRLLKNHHKLVASSEPELFLSIAERNPDGGVVIGLIGEGQSIHLGEEAGIELWARALEKSHAAWKVHCPPQLADAIGAAHSTATPALSLTHTLRAHSATRVHAWVECLLAGRIEAAQSIAMELRESGFFLLITSDLAQAEAYFAERYEGELEKTFGIVASSQASSLEEHGIKTDFRSQLKLSEIGRWFYGKDGLGAGCRSFEKPATEFQCQGLELDGVLLAWGEDFMWVDGGWRARKARVHPGIRDARKLRENAYRVLLSRARDGIIVFCPPTGALRGTYEALTQAGFVSLATG
ncbi:MAG: DNA/RNA helicase domain-containing protein [Thermoplasmatota archaeon]